MSRVTCHISRVTCHVSGVTCHFFLFLFLQSGGASWWRVCYQRGLLRLVFNCLLKSFAQVFCSPIVWYDDDKGDNDDDDDDDDDDDNDDDDDEDDDDDDEDITLTVVQFQGTSVYCHDDHQPSAPPDGSGHHCHLPRLPVQAVRYVSLLCVGLKCLPIEIDKIKFW